MTTYFCPSCGQYFLSLEDKKSHAKRTGHKVRKSGVNPLAAAVARVTG